MGKQKRGDKSASKNKRAVLHGKERGGGNAEKIKAGKIGSQKKKMSV